MSKVKLSIKDEMTRNAMIVFLAIICASVTIIYKVVDLKLNSEDFVRIDHISEEAVPAYRGNIYDCNYELLATSLPFYKASIDLGSEAMSDALFNSSVDSLAICLAGYYKDQSVADVRARLKKSRSKKSRYFLLSNSLSYNDYQKFKEFPLLREGRFRGGFLVDRYFDRMHPFAGMARRTIGFEGKDKKHDVGLERMFDGILKGVAGRRAVHRIKEDLWLPMSDENIKEPKPGNHLVSTLDMSFQEIVHNELERALLHHDALSGTAILMDVETGDIKAMASLKEVAEGKYREVLNASVQQGGDPGSTFKAASMLALLEDGLVDIDQVVPTYGGKYRVADIVIKDSSTPKSDSMTIRKAFAKSSNAVVSSLVNEKYKRKAEKYVELLDGFGLRAKTNVPIENEVSPYIKHPKENSKDWYGTTLAMMAYGYEMRLSPLQILQFYNGVANDGVLMKARLVSAILDGNNELEKEFLPEILNKRMARHDAIDQLKEMLEEVVISGTASHNKLSTVCDFAGKTGTTQLNYSKRKSGVAMTYAGSFVGYFPRKNPSYSLMVKISNPRKKGYYGAQIALPAFKRILNLVISSESEHMLAVDSIGSSSEIIARNLLNKKGEAGDYQKIIESIAGTKNIDVSNFDESNFDNTPENVIPDVRKLGLRDALFLLENRGLQVVIKGNGKVYKQSILPGTAANRQVIKIFLS